MRYSKYLLCAGLLLGVAACEGDNGATNNPAPGPAALVRFINAVPDTGTVDLRFVDLVENLPTMQGVAFRATSGFFQRVEPGSRAARVFPNSTNPALTSIRLVDTTVALAGDSRYTLVYAGRASGNQDRLAVLSEAVTPPTPPAGNIAIKALHVSVGTGNVDVYVVPVDSASAVTPADWATVNAGKLTNVGYLGQSAYANLPVRPTTPATSLYRFIITDAGTTTIRFCTTPNLTGSAAPAGSTYGPSPGVQIAGSVLTLVVAPGSIAGTRQSTTGTQSPAGLLIVDKVLNP
jgi:hypothetical protein